MRRTIEVYELMRRAGRPRGPTLTGDLIASAGEDAGRVVEDAETMRLARGDRIRFAETPIDPPEPNERLARAAKGHAGLIEPPARLRLPHCAPAKVSPAAPAPPPAGFSRQRVWRASLCRCPRGERTRLEAALLREARGAVKAERRQAPPRLP